MFNEGFNPGTQSADGRFSAHHRGKAVFEDEGRFKVLHLQIPLRGLFQGQFGNESDNLA